MKTSHQRLKRLIGGIGLSIAAVITVIIPVGYFWVSLASLNATLSFESHLKANRLAKYIYANESLWQYQTVRLAEIIEVPEANETGFKQRVVDAGGMLVLETSETLAFPTAIQAAPIVVGGETIGLVESIGSFRPQVLASSIVALLSGLLGWATFFALRVLPLRALDRTFTALISQTQRFETALANMSQGLCMFDSNQRLVVSNARFAELFGIRNETIVPGMAEADVMRLAGARSPGDVKVDDTSLLHGQNGNLISLTRERMENGGEVVTYEDITERRQSEAKIAHMARHDALTNLPNRLIFHEQLEKALSEAGTADSLAVLCLDIDDFKMVNDTLGHGAGDTLLQAFSGRLQTAVRDIDHIARLGGDEFAIVLTGVARPDYATPLADRLIELMAEPFEIDGHQVVVGTSIGIALSPADGTAPATLLKNADLALYRAKADGRGTYRYFEAEMDARMQRRRVIESDLRKALVRGEFLLFYQPIVDSETEAVLGFEALLRWEHPERGMIQPDEFISIAEETGMIVPIGEWVVNQACHEATAWPEHVKVAVNLSPVQFKSRNLVPSVKAALDTSGLRHSRLELEITETVLLQDSEITLGVLHEFRDLGVRISMDDFGTGYSSLSYLRQFPFDKIKIDRSFINEMSDREDSLVIVRAISAIGVSLGMSTTAEGVETREQVERVKKEGFTEMQGFFFSRPQRASELNGLLAELSRRSLAGVLSRRLATATRSEDAVTRDVLPSRSIPSS